MIRLHQFEISPYCDKVRRVLHWKRQPYEVVEVPLTRSPSLRRLSQAGKLPILEHEGRVIADSTDITHYLEQRFPDPPLVPKSARERGLCHALEDWADESLYWYEMRLRFGLPHNAARWIPRLVHADPPVVQRLAPLFVGRLMGRQLSAQGVGRKPIEAVLHDVERHVDAVDGLLDGRDWLVGEALSLADLGVFVQLFCIRGSQEGARLVDARPRVAAWMERVDRATAAPDG